ncbi:MAG: hypothetical protein HUJ65_06320, partial [Oscillospiraceae bacterium]|nr:hypothetical protein [Oscillospiraceae bacterium]
GEELEVDFEAGTAHGSDGAEYSPGALGYGTLYVPVSLMCSYFGLRQSYITASPADIIRINSGSSSIPDAFIPMALRSQLTNAYREYSMQNPPVIVEPLPDEEDTPDEEEEDEKLNGITVSVSVIGTENADRALAALSAMHAKAVFFVSVSDILENPGVIRRLDGYDMPLGVLLEEGTPEELEHALRLLYEASAVHTMLVTASGDVSRDAEKTCRDMGYIYLGPDVYFDTEPGYFTLKASIPSEEGSEAQMAFSGGALTESVFLNISEIGCAVGIIDELSGAD